MIPYAISIKYMIAGYIVMLAILGAYLASLILRWRSLKRDLHLLENMNDEEEATK
jgi:hypothetical protein